MTRDDIIRMAREAGAGTPALWHGGDYALYGEVVIQRFAALVAAAEREACAKLVESRKTGASELMDAVRDMEAAAIRKRGEVKP